jgi:hypothetical protein
VSSIRSSKAIVRRFDIRSDDLGIDVFVDSTRDVTRFLPLRML